MEETFLKEENGIILIIPVLDEHCKSKPIKSTAFYAKTLLLFCPNAQNTLYPAYQPFSVLPAADA
ncbi:MAG: hypothetical protein VB111_09455 [Clostridiaceae bacterium]|nr:hypothetical protein [Clostridiaceae bacterium]